MIDSFMGQCVIDAKEGVEPDNISGEDTRTIRILDLFNRKDKKTEKMPGVIRLTVGQNLKCF